MPVYVVRFEHESRVRWGVLRGPRIHPLEGSFETTGELVRAHDVESLVAHEGPSIDVGAVRLLAPVTRNQRFVCQGANYRQHMIESGLDPDAKSFNMIFTKASSCIAPADGDVVMPHRVRLLDYEIELGLVMRRDIRGPLRVTDGTLHELVAGAVIVNDYSARDVQIPQMQFYKGKSFRTFGPVGPRLALLHRDHFPRLRRLRLTLRVNGQVRQDDSTANLVYGPAETLTELSGVQDFNAGDLLSTGTPAGCALSVPSPRKQRLAALLPEATRWKAFFRIQSQRPQYLRVGDVVESRICSEDGALDLGVQRNRIVAEAP
jgi:2-keto-4-pentenoate hydratase/2-oxohepta-3-ene-1,7-dioic acid hydratase in catechol pathway